MEYRRSKINKAGRKPNTIPVSNKHTGKIKQYYKLLL